MAAPMLAPTPAPMNSRRLSMGTSLKECDEHYGRSRDENAVLRAVRGLSRHGLKCSESAEGVRQVGFRLTQYVENRLAVGRREPRISHVGFLAGKNLPH